jgi:hypothetical protein
MLQITSLAPYADPPIAFLSKPVGNRQPHSSPFAHTLCGITGVKDIFQNLGRHALL